MSETRRRTRTAGHETEQWGKKKYPPKTHRHEDWWLRIRRGTAGGGAGAFGSAKDANGDGGDAMAACCTSAALGGDGEDYGGTR